MHRGREIERGRWGGKSMSGKIDEGNVKNRTFGNFSLTL